MNTKLTADQRHTLNCFKDETQGFRCNATQAKALAEAIRAALATVDAAESADHEQRLALEAEVM